ncbi:MAG: GNAT family N-acetyltransferase [Coriobacteriia bacterium]|nr:GNAT family N-acetyltransferase [Coriobacteriia bacterium]
MAGSSLRAAAHADLQVIWPAVRAAHLFADKASFERHHAQAPWRVRISSAGAAAVLERWRDELDVLSIRGMWCSEPKIPQMVRELAGVARAQGFARILSPLIPVDCRGSYERAGMKIEETLVSLRIDRTLGGSMRAELPGAVRVRRCTQSDVPDLDALDRACFAPFWAYGVERISSYVEAERVVIAEIEGRAIGYTLCTVERGSGTLGRLAVLPDERRQGVGACLVFDAVSAMLASGAAAVTLCTQQDNHAARSLYRGMGFRELPGELVLLMGQA